MIKAFVLILGVGFELVKLTIISDPLANNNNKSLYLIVSQHHTNNNDIIDNMVFRCKDGDFHNKRQRCFLAMWFHSKA